MKKPGLRDAAFLLILVITLALHLNRFADDPGLGWHLTNGLQILKSFQIPRVDSFLSSASPRPWVCDQWLSDVIFAAVYSAGGWPLLYAALVLLFFATFFLLLCDLVKKICGSELCAIIAAVLAFKLAELHFIVRPTLLSILMFVLLLRILVSHEYLGVRAITYVFLLFLFWANLHPAFVNGFAFLVIDGAVRVAKNPRTWSRAVFACGAALLATLINPWGVGLHESIAQLAGSDYFLTLNSEWLPLPRLSFEQTIFAVVFFLTVIGARRTCTGAQCGVALVISSFLFAYLGIDHVRMLPYFAVVSAIPCAFGILEVTSYFRPAVFNFTRSALKRLEHFEEGSLRGRSAALFAAILLPLSAVSGLGLPFYHGSFGPSPAAYPFGALEKLREQASQKIVVLSSPNWGGFITWHAYEHGVGDKLKAVIDDRNTLLGEAFYKTFFDVMKPRDDFLRVVRQYSASHLLLSRGGPLDRFLSEKNRMIPEYVDSQSALYRLPERY